MSPGLRGDESKRNDSGLEMGFGVIALANEGEFCWHRISILPCAHIFSANSSFMFALRESLEKWCLPVFFQILVLPFKNSQNAPVLENAVDFHSIFSCLSFPLMFCLSASFVLSLSLCQTVFRIVVLGIWDYIENKVEVSSLGSH